MEKTYLNKGAILFYIITMLMTYLLIIRVESLDNVTQKSNSIVYVKTN